MAGSLLFSRSRILGMSELAQLKICVTVAGVGVFFPSNAAITFSALALLFSELSEEPAIRL